MSSARPWMVAGRLTAVAAGCRQLPGGRRWRRRSPAARSGPPGCAGPGGIFTTSAPMAHSEAVQAGPATTRLKSRMRMPSRARATGALYAPPPRRPGDRNEESSMRGHGRTADRPHRVCRGGPRRRRRDSPPAWASARRRRAPCRAAAPATTCCLAPGGGAYLELIGPDPTQDVPAGQAAALRHRPARPAPALVGFARQGAGSTPWWPGPGPPATTPATCRACSGPRPTAACCQWRLTLGGSHDGLVPFLIDWLDSPHPSTTTPRRRHAGGAAGRAPRAGRGRGRARRSA